MHDRNKDLRDYMKDKKIPMWRVAERLGIVDSTFSRMLRYEISEDKRNQIIKATDELALLQ